MDIGSVIGGGFRLIRQKPAAVAAWALVYLLVFAAMSLLMRPLMQAQTAAIGGDPQVELAAVGALMGRILLLALLFLIAYTMLFAASLRAVLQPERSSFFYLRLGMDELRLFALMVIFVIAFYAAMIVVGIVMAVIIGLFAATSGSPGSMIGMVAILYIVMLVGGVFFSTRFALAFPLTLMRGKIIIGESWRITRGRFWQLFTALLLIFLIVLALWIAGSLVTSGSYFAELARSGGDPAAIQQAGQQQMARQLGGITGTMVVGWVIGAVAGAVGIALWGGAVATAARELTFDRNAIAETFA